MHCVTGHVSCFVFVGVFAGSCSAADSEEPTIIIFVLLENGIMSTINIIVSAVPAAIICLLCYDQLMP